MSEITIIIPTFRRAKSLKNVLEKVLAQGFKDFLLLIVDDCSKDNETATLLAEFEKRDERIKYHIQPKNLGHIENLKWTINQVKTPYFLYLSDDDLLLPNALEVLFKNAQKYPESSYISGVKIEVNFESKAIRTVYQKNWPRYGLFYPKEGLANYLKLLGPGICATLIKTSCFQEIGGIDENTDYNLELDLFLKLSGRFPFTIISEPVAIWGFSNNSMSAKISLEKYWPGGQVIIDNFKKEKSSYPKNSPSIESLLNETLGKNLMTSGRYHLSRGETEKVNQILHILFKEINLPSEALKLLAMKLFSQCFPFYKQLKSLLSKKQVKVKKSPHLIDQFPEYKDFVL